ncbi:MAG: putative baseplate assembly protein [Actinomycetota bacterium]
MGDHGPGLCGCCAGLDAETPVRIHNAAGRAAVAYRAGAYAAFKESLLARLSGSDVPALGRLTTREDGDLTIALLDALATALDVLTFYQERIANENFLRTATERRSILELARLIGYELAPGVAGSTRLAFTLQEVPGSPALAAGPVEIPAGSRVQSVPGPGETAQTFETVEAVEARAEWNAIPVQASAPWSPGSGDREVWLSGLGLALQAGDAILLVGRERLEDPGSGRWDIRVATAVEEDEAGRRTRVVWQAGLGDVAVATGLGAQVFVFRRRAGLFGHNAPDPRLMSPRDTQLGTMTQGSGASLTWKSDRFSIQGSTIDLDAAYPKVTPGSFFALVSNHTDPHPSGLSGYVALYRAGAVSYPSRTDFALTGKVTRIEPDTEEGLDDFRDRIRENVVLAEPEPLTVSETPLPHPLHGETVALARLAPGIEPGRALAVGGKRARIGLRLGTAGGTLQLDEGGTVAVGEGDCLRLAAAPERKTGAAWTALTPAQFGGVLTAPGAATLRLRLIDRDGRTGALTIAASEVRLEPAQEEDEEVAEIAFVGDLPASVTHDRARTTLGLAAPLSHCYDRATARVNANVARATHGETVTEILGGGDARVPNARFPLRQAPLTFVSAATPSGRLSTLAVRVNDLLWGETDRLYGRGPAERVYEVDVGADAEATVRFGDGIEGARPPSGDHNVRATYRKGLGAAGNVAAGRLSNLLSRPLGVTGVTNPEAAGGGEDPEQDARARANAPLTVRTLDRAVSIRDYADFARAFAGIAKAHAVWVPAGPARGIFVTVAGESGAAVLPGSDTYDHLLDALHRYGDPLLPIELATYRDARFRVRLSVRVAPDADPGVVLPAVDAALGESFGFEARAFGQGASLDEVAAAAQGVAGVEAVHVAELHRTDTPSPALVARLPAALPQASLTAAPLAAELLTLDAASPEPEPMT